MCKTIVCCRKKDIGMYFLGISLLFKKGTCRHYSVLVGVTANSYRVTAIRGVLQRSGYSDQPTLQRSEGSYSDQTIVADILGRSVFPDVSKYHVTLFLSPNLCE